MTDKIVLLVVFIISAVALMLVPRNQAREAQLVFLFQQFTCWILGILVVQWGMLEYPVRELQANRTSFVFEYFIYPVIAVYYNLYLPENKSGAVKLLYLVVFSGGITITEWLIEKYTDLIEYNSWTSYDTLLSITLTLLMSRWFRVWFFAAFPQRRDDKAWRRQQGHVSK